MGGDAERAHVERLIISRPSALLLDRSLHKGSRQDGLFGASILKPASRDIERWTAGGMVFSVNIYIYIYIYMNKWVYSSRL